MYLQTAFDLTLKARHCFSQAVSAASSSDSACPSLPHKPTLGVPAPSPALAQLPSDVASWVWLVNGSPKSTDCKPRLIWEDGFQLSKLAQAAAFSAVQHGAGTRSRGPPPSSFS